MSHFDEVFEDKDERVETSQNEATNFQNLLLNMECFREMREVLDSVQN